MIKPKIQVGYFSLVIFFSVLFFIPLNVSAQENPVNATNLSQISQINITVSLTQTVKATPSPAPVQTIIRETTAIPPVLPASITILPAIPSMTVPTTPFAYAVRPETTELSPVPTIIPIITASNQNSVQESNPVSMKPVHFSPEDSPQQGSLYEIKKDFITDSLSGQKYAKDRVIVRFRSNTNAISSVSEEKIRMAHTKIGAKVKKDFSVGGITGLHLVLLPNGTDVQSAIKEYLSNPDVLYAEPDYVVSIPPEQTLTTVQDTNPAHILAIPNDEWFFSLWGLNNIGQTGGTPDADIDVPEAWDISTGSSSVVVAVIDTGVMHTHSDLSSNIWNNTGEIPDNDIDDDGNGYIDDTWGWDFVNNDNDPTDDNSHGTHVSGTIGATGNNAIGISGVNWQVKIMPLKAFNSTGYGFLSAEIDAIQYANEKGAVVISNSWGGSSFSQSLKDVIDASPAVVVCAAGNNASDNDAAPYYPAGYSSPNIIAVAATDHNDTFASFSNFGLISVDLAAPGRNIWSTSNNGDYAYKSGTSMATPHVSGVAALVKSVNQSLTAVQIKNIILSTVDIKSSLSGKVSTGGRLNAYKALVATPPSQPIADFTGMPMSGTAPLTVMFTDLSANLPRTWLWVFGDGNTTNSTEQSPIHTYIAGGNYTVSLTVTNLLGSNTVTKAGYVNIPTPFANFTGSPENGVAPLTVVFSDISTNGPTAWNWTFGDGNVTNSDIQNPVHTYLTAGIYDVSLNASNSVGFITITKIGYIKVSSEVVRTPYGLGVYRPSVHTFYLKNGTAVSWTTTAINWGTSTDLPVTGDWNGDGITDIGVYRPSAHTFYLKNGTAVSWTTTAINWGTSTDLPVTGKWS